MVLASEASINFEETEHGTIAFAFHHPHFEHTVWDEIDPSGLDLSDKDSLAMEAARIVTRRYMSHLTSDIHTAKGFHQPLGTTIWIHGELLKRAASKLEVGNVAFQLNLPILENIPVETLVRIRLSEQTTFERFRYALRTAIGERLQSSAESNSQAIAEQIRGDLIEPELQRIGDRLRRLSHRWRRRPPSVDSLVCL